MNPSTHLAAASGSAPLATSSPATVSTSAAPDALAMREAVQRVIDYFEALSPASLAQLSQHYAPQARFKDPFNAVQGLAEIERIFRHMFDTLEQPRFVITGQVLQGHECFLTWDFKFRFKSMLKGQDQCIVGATHLVFSPEGRVTLHRDYWDAAEELYEKLPVVGALMRWLKKQAS